MKNLIQGSLLYDIIVEDEMDQAFNALPLITPPTTLVDNIMAAVAQLSLPQPLKPTSILDNMGVLYVSLDPQQLS